MAAKLSPPQSISHERKELVSWLLERHLQQSALSCIVCGCTENNACIVEGPDGPQPCGWIKPGLCSNPDCVEAFEAETQGVLLDDDEEEEGLVA
jgi:hypothetical protein